jgi:hypothetical protein
MGSKGEQLTGSKLVVDGCTNFFHANATIKLRRNIISFLKDSQDHIRICHEAKAQLLWASSYKERHCALTLRH